MADAEMVQRSPVTVYVQGPMIRSAMTGGMVRAHADLCFGADDHTGLCPVHGSDTHADADPAEDLPCPCDCSCESLAACLRLADERWPDPPHWPKDAHRVGICCDDSGMIANPDSDGLIPCPGRAGGQS